MSDVCVCVCVRVCRRHDKVIVLSEFGELVDSQIPQERGDQSCLSPTTIHSAECKMRLRKEGPYSLRGGPGTWLIYFFNNGHPSKEG